MKKVADIYRNHLEGMRYLVFGALATVINLGVKFILLFTILLFIVVKDKTKSLKIHGIIIIISSALMIIFIRIAKTIIELKFKNINISILTNYISINFLEKGLVLIIFGFSEIMISEYIKSKKTQF